VFSSFRSEDSLTFRKSCPTMETLLASIIAFVVTNLDDIFILILFFSDRKLKRRNIITGQFLGISTLILFSFLGSFVGLIIDIKYVGLLGVIPIYIGIKSFIALWSPETSDEKVAIDLNNTGSHLRQTLSVASVTIANGGDNISIYIPLFAAFTNSGKITMTIVFLLMTAVWCFIANHLSNYPMIKRSLEKYGHIVTPFVFILLGIYIMYESKTFELLLNI
jgi:cadmium resistance transport/sequestration family protein